MSRNNFFRGILLGSAVFGCTSAFAQVDIQLRARQLPGWNAGAREGRCEIRVWVDNRAEVRMRGDTVFVRTLEGSKGRDEGSECSQPLPLNSVRDFQIRQTAGRSRVSLTQEPGRMNNFTAMITIEDKQGGGDNYAFEATWHSDSDIAKAPAPFFDDVRACQDIVRQRFLSQNGRGSYIDFENFADRQGQNENQGKGRNNGRNRDQETIQGRGSARSWSESRDLTYTCSVDTRRGQVIAGDYRLSGGSLRTNDRTRLK
jgi:hypothetical protein